MIFVTGGSGFLGSHILEELVSQGKSVKALYRNRRLPAYMPPGLSEKITWVQGDILDLVGLAENMAGCERVIHAAALVSFDPSEKKKLFKNNIEGTANLVNTSIELGITDFVHVSSVGALGNAEGSQPITEEKKWLGNNGLTNYSISKYYAEMEVWRGMGEGLSPLIVNPVVQLGFGDWNETSCGMFKAAFQEFPWYMNGRNGFADVRDTARATVALMNSGIRNERFIINAENRTYLEIFTWMARGFGKKPPARKAGALIASLAWRIEKIKSGLSDIKPLITRESVAIVQKQAAYDAQKMLRALPDFRFRRLEDSILEACSKYLENIKNP
jgi:dihydroflavonol-4-reductase